jgi:hypothetical protein
MLVPEENERYVQNSYPDQPPNKTQLRSANPENN